MQIKIIFSILFAFLLQSNSVNILHAATIHTYAENSVLSKGKWAKIKISETGVHKLTYDEIRNMGFSNPSDIRVFGFGGAMLNEYFMNAKIDDLPEIAIYDSGSYILFYAQGPVKWNNNLNSSNCRFNFTLNPYSNYGYYFLTTDAGKGKRINVEAIESGEEPSEVTNFIDYKYIKKEEINFSRSGRTWYGDIMTNGGSKNYSFTFPNIETGKEMRIQVSAVGASTQSTSLKVTYGSTTETLSFSTISGHVRASAKETCIKKYPSSDNISLSLLYLAKSSSDKAALNYIVVNAWRKLIMSGSSMSFRNYECLGYDSYSRFTLQEASSDTKIWNVTDMQNITEVPSVFSGSTLQFVKKTDELQEFVALNPSGQFPKPEFVGLVSNQNLHALPATVDFVIISHPDFLSEADRLSKKHEEFDQVNVVVVTPEQIYNEFSSGTPDATAYRWLMKMLYDRDETKSPKYLLLFGDGSYDNKDILTSKTNPSHNFILTFQSYTSINDDASFCTDDYFGFVGDSEGNPGNYGSAKVNIGIGRFPVSTLDEAKTVVDKAITYMENKNKGAWKNKVCLVADDNEGSASSPSTFNRFFTYSEKISNIISSKNPGMEIKKLYFDAFTRVTGSNGNRFPEVESQLQEEIKTGVTFLNYIGHSGITGWAEEHVFTQAQARTLQNKNWGFWFTASCEFTRFDDLTTYSGGEDLFLNPNGGVIALYSASRVVFDTNNDRLNTSLANVLFERDEEGKPRRFGDIYKLSKQAISTDTYKNDTNKLAFVLLADPMLRIAYPDLLVKTDSITFLPDVKTDTIKALSEVKVYGSIEDLYESQISNFSGKLKIKVYDKELTLYTKAQVYSTEEERLKNRFAYKDRPNVLYSGETTVEDGKFSFLFKVPKDINYNYGFGRINYYAYDDNNGFEAQGAYQNFVIGGSDSNMEYETQGPEVTLYLNTGKFKSGDKVNESPVFFAFVKDESGINTSGAGIGHDITLTLNDSKTPIVLNSSFNFFPNKYTEGSLAYQLENLEAGKYTLTFKVWDLLNNSTTKQIQFEVEKGLPIKIEEVIAWPNPAREYVHFRIQHDRPESVLECRVRVYDLDGRLVYESDNKDFDIVCNDAQHLSAHSANESDDEPYKDLKYLSLDWDLNSSAGSRVSSGIYVYRIDVRTADGDYAGKSQKLIIQAQ